MKTKFYCLFLFVVGLLGQSTIGRAAELSYLLVPGVPGDAIREQWKTHIEVFGYSHEVISPRDAGSGLPTGKRQHGVFKLIKRVGNNSPHLVQKFVQNANLAEVDLKLIRPNPTGDGTTQHYYTYTLKNARIVGIRNWSPNSLDPAAPDVSPMEEISFVYQTIEWTYEPNGVTVEDSVSDR